MIVADESMVVQTYFELFYRQKFIAKDLDYAIFDKYKPMLSALAFNSNTCVGVFDVYKKEHIYFSSNFEFKQVNNLTQIIDQNHNPWISKIHPEDFKILLENGISLLKLFYQFSADEKLNYKLANEYRILNSINTYTQVIEQHQILELDNYGNIWLILTVTDISPIQTNEAIKTQLFNFKTGKTIPFDIKETNLETMSMALSNREKKMLKKVKQNIICKDFYNCIEISLQTVNHHRKKFLEKLGTNNLIDSVVLAAKLGLV